MFYYDHEKKTCMEHEYSQHCPHISNFFRTIQECNFVCPSGCEIEKILKTSWKSTVDDYISEPTYDYVNIMIKTENLHWINLDLEKFEMKSNDLLIQYGYPYITQSYSKL